MREICFRGKRQSDGVWEYGFYYAKPVLEKHFILLGEDQWLVEKESVSQFTGLYDKYGKMIFEGDIFSVTWIAEGRTPVVSSFVVEFKNGCFYARTFNGNKIVGTVSNYAKCGKVGNTGVFVEVIGNIHDNPELLEVYHGNQ